MKQSIVLHVDHERDVRELVRVHFTQEGFRLHIATNAEEAMRAIDALRPHLILLEADLPDVDGIDMCRRIREETNAPLIFLSRFDSETERIIGLSIGGDDFVAKPFNIHELVARAKVHLRRYHELLRALQARTLEEVEQWKSPSITLNRTQFKCFVNGRKITLSSKEFELLALFMTHPFQVLTAHQLLERIWGYDALVDPKTVAVHIGNLRRKLGDDPRNPSMIVTIRGVGYKFNEEVTKRCEPIMSHSTQNHPTLF